MNRDPAAHVAGKPDEAGEKACVWDMDGAHSAAHFRIRHLMIANVRGQFSRISGSVSLDEQDITRSKVEGAVEVGSINTREAERDGHLKSGDFFDAAKFPKITFRSTRIVRDIDGKLILNGDLTIRNVTKPIAFEVGEVTPQMRDPWGKLRFGVSARGQINRKDFGLTWNQAIEGGGLLVGEQVNITIEAEFVRREG
jgi:polyisoprenoid-binding protein YceI